MWPAIPTAPPIRQRLPMVVLPEIPVQPAITVCAPMRTLWPTCTRLSIFTSSSITVSSMAPRSMVVLAPTSTSAPRRTTPSCGTFTQLPRSGAKPKPSAPSTTPGCSTRARAHHAARPQRHARHQPHVLGQLHPGQQRAVRADEAARPDDHVLADEGERLDAGAGVDAGAGGHHRARMDPGGEGGRWIEQLGDARVQSRTGSRTPASPSDRPRRRRP